MLHGWPQCGSAFDTVLERLGDDFFVAAPDLPGIGRSHGAPASGEKAAIAPHIERVIDALGAREVILVGQDVGGMVAFACFRQFGERLDGGVIVNTVIPGIDPWDQLLADPRIWHFAFHAIPDLPETVVSGRERPYFDYFFNMRRARPSASTRRRGKDTRTPTAGLRR